MNTNETNLSIEPRELSNACGSAGQKKCSNCGSEFQCGAAVGAATGSADFSCWCEELPRLTPATDQDCFCPECLRAAIEKLAE
ncbi:MAG TPA: hypothetical protein VGN90_08545 [Pyrinomonadaceae bacterium]|jgi:hypothetical protein|nr:hypothetical protein [Pyrinomonadaceae bacterium]